MAIAITFEQFLCEKHVNYEVVTHNPTQSSYDSSCSAHLPNSQVAKAIVLETDNGEYLMATLSVAHRVSLEQVKALTGKEYHLVNEARLSDLFPDCQQGAIPAIGQAYHLDMMVDDALLNVEEVYIEAGDHEHLLKISHQQYCDMLASMPHGDICGSVIGIPRNSDVFSSEWYMS
jgi:Ala-tRNA(Pro) deacylase